MFALATKPVQLLSQSNSITQTWILVRVRFLDFRGLGCFLLLLAADLSPTDQTPPTLG